MSFILDALKKSEAERQRQAGPALLEMRVVRPRNRWPAWALVLGGALILANFGLLAWLLLREPAPAPVASVPAPPAAPAAAPTAPPLASAPATALPVAPPQPLAGAPLESTDAAPAVGNNDGNPADLEPAAPPVTARRGAGLQTYAELSGTLPPLRLDLHVYAAQPVNRYAFINMRKVTEGSTTAEGMRVVEITPEGVVLDFRNSEFLLGRE